MEFFRVLLTVLIVMDPIGMIPQFLAVTAGIDEQHRRSVIKKSALIAAVVLAVFLLAGKPLLSFFGITSGAFYISGGILFFLIAFEMIYSKGGPRSTPSGDNGENGVSVALFPLAIPLIAGPGLITVIIMYTSRSQPWLYSVSILAPALAAGLAVTYLILRASALILRVLGATGIFVMEKIMGLILSGYAIQLVYNGLRELGVIG